ncbi:unnamed protein product [Prorocentrum cordatum]|uniref:EamA domain-containing protein n=1 Tax=Prorocentrum cordatum TaxID=2364126 RepID=A0ABN9W0Q2_9DINO|nr:unnamed protein product [Polarella glacialis]
MGASRSALRLAAAALPGLACAAAGIAGAEAAGGAVGSARALEAAAGGHPINAAETSICLACSAMSGVGVGFFGCLLAASDVVRKANGNRHTRRSKLGVTIGAVGSTVFGLGSLVGLYFGPVTFVTMARTGTALPANVVFSQVFQLRPLGRDDYLGTVITISSAICFMIFVGQPGDELSRDAFEEVIRSAPALSLLGGLAAIWAACTVYIVALRARGMHERRGVRTATAVSLMTGCSSAFMDVSTKGWAACLRSAGGPLEVVARGGWLFWACVVANVFFMVFMRFGLIWGCQHCDVLLFVPLNSVLNTLFSVVAGIVALSEGSGVISWAGLVFSGISCATGTVLLAGGPQDVIDDARSDIFTEGGAEDDEGDGAAEEASPQELGGAAGEATPYVVRLCSAGNWTTAVSNMNMELKARWRHKSRIRSLVDRISKGGRRRADSTADSADGSSESEGSHEGIC